MRITSIESKPLTEIRYLNAGRGPGDFYNDVVPVHRGFVDALPEGTSAIVVTADLQGHDTFGTDATPPRFSPPVYFLDNDYVTIGGTKIAGLSGITGNPRRPWRRTEDDYDDALESLLLEQPTITLMHDGPDVPGAGFRGSPRTRQVFERSDKTLVVRGHAHWNEPLAELSCGTQVLNVDARVVVLTSSRD